jgi:hypothetical protein
MIKQKDITGTLSCILLVPQKSMYWYQIWNGCEHTMYTATWLPLKLMYPVIIMYFSCYTVLTVYMLCCIHGFDCINVVLYTWFWLYKCCAVYMVLTINIVLYTWFWLHKCCAVYMVLTINVVLYTWFWLKMLCCMHGFDCKKNVVLYTWFWL